MDGWIDRNRWLPRQTQQERKRQGRCERKMNGELYKWWIGRELDE